MKAAEGSRQKKRLEAQAALFQADIALLPKDDVVEEFDLQRLASAAQLFCGANVLRRYMENFLANGRDLLPSSSRLLHFRVQRSP
jgi:hypothetical protein